MEKSKWLRVAAGAAFFVFAVVSAGVVFAKQLSVVGGGKSFSSTASITVLAPAKAAKFVKGNNLEIKWIAVGVSKVGIILKRQSSGAEPVAIISNPTYPAALGSFFWKVPTILADGEDYVVSVYNFYGGQEWLSEPFIVARPPVGTSTTAFIISPNGGVGEKFVRGRAMNISWFSRTSVPTSVNINLKNLGTGKIKLIASVPNQIGNNTYNYTLSGSQSVGSYKVVVSASVGGSVLDESDNSFEIVPAPPKITSLSPTKGPAGTIVTIYGSGFTSDRPNFINLADVVNHRGMTIEAIAADSSHLYFTAPNVPYRDYQISVDNETNGWCENYKTFTVTAK